MTKKLADVSEKDWRALLGLNKSSKLKRNKKSRAQSQPAIVDDSASLPQPRIEKRRDRNSESRDTVIEKRGDRKELADVSEKDWRTLSGLDKSSTSKRNKNTGEHLKAAIVDDELDSPFDDSDAWLDFSNMEDNRRSFKRRAIPFSDMVGNKRGKFGDQLSENSQASETVYRILCHSRKIGSVIGKGSGVVKALREETQVKITVADSVPGSEEMVIVVYSFSTKNPVTQNTDMELQCAAQDALLKVHDRIVEEESGTGNENVVTARLLVPNNTVGCLLGKNGDVIKRLQSQTGASIHVLPADQLPVCAMSTDELVQVMLDIVGAEMHVVNKSEKAISLQHDDNVILSLKMVKKASSQVLRINFDGLAKVMKKGDNIFVGGSENTSVWLEVDKVDGNNVDCKIKNSATLVGALFTLHASQIHIDLPTLTEKDKELLVGKFKGVARSRLGLKYRLMKKKRSNKTRFRAKKKSQIYLDGSFLFQCFIQKMNIRNMKYKGMKFEIVVTVCTWKELAFYVNQFTEHSIESIYDSMRDQVSTKNCGHKDNMHAQDCIMSCVGENKNKALIASDDTCFLQKLSENPLIPVVVIEGGNFAFKCLSKNHRREYLFFREPGDDPDEERLMDRMKLFEFEHVKVMGDGNCLLRALAEQITHDEHNHGIVRELLSGQIEQNEELYKEDAQNFMSHHQEFKLQATYSHFVKYFSKVDALAPFFITVQAASDYFKAKIVCISSEEKAVFLEFAPHDVDDPKIVWYLSLLATEDGHADSVYPQRTPSKYCRHLYDLNTLPMVTEEDSS